VAAPRDEIGLSALFDLGLRRNGPMMIRFPRGEAIPSLHRIRGEIFLDDLPVPEILEKGTECALLGYGKTVELMLQAREIIVRDGGVPPSVVDIKCVKPMCVPVMEELLKSHELVIVAEDGYKECGVGEAIASLAEKLRPLSRTAMVLPMGIPDLFVPQGTVSEQAEYCGLTPRKVVTMYEEYQKRTHRQGSGIQGVR
jgi:1-deoxy-D-xylulose-5-phosphate synthase